MARITCFLQVVNVGIIPLFGLISFLISQFVIPSEILDIIEFDEIKSSLNSTPLMGIEVRDTNQNDKTALFGEYKGLKGGHTYPDCSVLFPSTCDSDLNKVVTCETYTDTEDGREYYDFAVNKERCVDYTTIKSFPYAFLEGKYYYAEKMSQTYEDLLKNTISKKKKCPKTKKSCGLLNKDIRLCLPIEEECPINDIIINNQSTYSENSINYKSVTFGDKYIHYTNEKTDNDIIFNLSLSIENPLSKIETREKDKNKIFKLHKLEEASYFSGNIENIRAYKKLADTGITFKGLFKSYGKFDTIQTEPYYRAEYFYSKIYIYIKYPVPLNIKSFEEIKNAHESYRNAYDYIGVFFFIYCITIFASILMIIKLKYRELGYVLLTFAHIIIIVFFILSCKEIYNSRQFTLYKDKNHHRIQLLIVNIVFAIVTIFHNLSSLYVLREKIKEDDEKEQKEKEQKEKETSENEKETPLYAIEN